ncbi:hypothetical protein [Nocardioides nematodiphilus]|uniref:hypothetical protein n=1 Tax=Nocardioides nematodiphilus TaxID=2849669 RepID=UPI001CDA1570|nr:hypothetical protein [Nocardioides nematodiphilus]MCA1983853.1 hypothetical protein [Nocardioides nematodiphilus]
MATCTVVLGWVVPVTGASVPAKDPAGYQARFGEPATLEQQRRSLRERLIG